MQDLGIAEPTTSATVAHLHLPETISFSGDVSQDQRESLDKAVLTAVRRAQQRVATEGSARPRSQVRDPTADLFHLDRFHPERGTYELPSYDDEGAPIEVVVKAIAARGTTNEVRPGPSPLEGILLMTIPGNNYRKLHSTRHVVASNLRNALQLGVEVFGTTGFAVMEGPLVDPANTYWAIGVDEPITEGDLGPHSDAYEVEGGELVTYGHRRIISPMYDDAHNVYVTRAVFTKEQRLLFGTARGGELWFAESQFIPQVALSAAKRRPMVFAEVDGLVAKVEAGDGSQLQEAARLLSLMTVDSFRLVDWETKVRYIKILLDAWTWKEEEIAIVAIFKSFQDGTEVDAVVDALKRSGYYDKLFSDVRSELWDLLAAVGELYPRDKGPLTFTQFYNMLVGSNLIRPSTISISIVDFTFAPDGSIVVSTTIIQEAEEAARSFIDFVGGIFESLWSIVTEPVKIVEGVIQLVKMIITVELASIGVPQAQEAVAKALVGVGQQVMVTLRGADRLRCGQEIVRRIEWRLIWEIASLFVGVGEIKAAIKGADIAGNIGKIARFLGILGRVGEAAESEVVVARLSRLARVFKAERAIFASEGEVADLLGHLPERDVKALGGLLKATDVLEGEKLADLLARDAQLGKAAEDALAKAEVLKALAGKAGGLSEEVGQAFRRLVSSPTMDLGQARKVIEAIPAGEGTRFIKVVERVGAEGLAREGSGAFLEAVAASTKRMDAVAELGPSTVRSLLARAEGKADGLDTYLEQLADIQKRYAAEGKADEYRKLLDYLDLEDRINASNARSLRAMGATDIDFQIERGVDDLETELVKGGKKPRIGDVSVPTTKRVRLDIGDFELLEGEKNQIEALARIRKVISKKVSDVPELREVWNAARREVVGGRSLENASRQEMLDLYSKVRNRFWDMARDDPGALGALKKAGFEFPPSGRAPLLKVNKPGMPIQERRISLDHNLEKALGENYKKAIDADNLTLEFHNPNSNRETVQVKFGLRAEGVED